MGAGAGRDRAWAVVLDGGCGEAECCGIYAQIAQDVDTVVWRAFWSNSSTQPIPPDLVLTFDRAEYEAALDGLVDRAPMPWNPRDTG